MRSNPWMAAVLAWFVATAALGQEPPPLEALPALEAPDRGLAELGQYLFFDGRLSGDGVVSCATCHQPDKGFADGQALGTGYPGTQGFRNTPTLINSAYLEFFYWDSRLDGADPATQVRDQVTESHVMAMDGRLMLERLKQVPEYVRRFERSAGGEPSFGRTLQAISAFEKTLVSSDTPFDRYMRGDSGALSADAAAGRALFEGKAGCISCHNGPLASDAQHHDLGVPENPDIVGDPVRHLTLRSFAKSLGVPNFERLREDPGYYIVTKQDEDWGKFRTPPLRELAWTAPYMHNGTLATLADVIAFYDAGGGTSESKDPLLKSLGLTAEERVQLEAFLLSMSGPASTVQPLDPPPYQVIRNWRDKEN